MAWTDGCIYCCITSGKMKCSIIYFTVYSRKMLRLYGPNLHFAGEPLDSIWSLRVWQSPSSTDPTVKPVMFRVREVNREQHVMTSTFLGWVAYQLSSHWLSALTQSPETPGNLLSKSADLNNITITKSTTSCVLNTLHNCSSWAISVSECWYKSTNNLSTTQSKQLGS